MRAIAQGGGNADDTGIGMRRTLTALALLGVLFVVPPAAPAQAATKSAAKATIKLVSPMRVKVGRTITITGRNFSSSRRRNTVIFRSPAKRTAFAKPRRAGRRKLIVRVPRRWSGCSPTRIRRASAAPPASAYGCSWGASTAPSAGGATLR